MFYYASNITQIPVSFSALSFISLLPRSRFAYFWPQTLCSLPFAGCSVDLVFVVDNSASVSYDSPLNWGIMQNFMNQVVNRLTVGPNGARVGMVQFAHRAVTGFVLREFNNVRDVETAINSTQFLVSSGGTNTAQALELTLSEHFNRADDGTFGNRDRAPNLAVVMTDGQSTSANTVQAATAAKQAGVIILSIGIGGAVETELRDISSPPQRRNETYFLSTTFAALSEILDIVSTTACEVATTVAPPPVTTRPPVVQFGNITQ